MRKPILEVPTSSVINRPARERHMLAGDNNNSVGQPSWKFTGWSAHLFIAYSNTGVLVFCFFFSQQDLFYHSLNMMTINVLSNGHLNQDLTLCCCFFSTLCMKKSH